MERNLIIIISILLFLSLAVLLFPYNSRESFADYDLRDDDGEEPDDEIIDDKDDDNNYTKILEQNENMTTPSPLTPSQINTCPNLLVQTDGKIFLSDSSKSSTPVAFNNLAEYVKFNNMQNTQNGTQCPLLYLSNSNTDSTDKSQFVQNPASSKSPLSTSASKPQSPTLTQNNNWPKPFQLGTPQTTPFMNPVNMGSSGGGTSDSGSLYPGFDPYGQDIGRINNLDIINQSTELQPVSDNAMDPNWGGTQYTNQVINSGKYDDYNITRPLLANVKSVAVNPYLLNEGSSIPRDII